jgi:hypothetical protein
MATHKQILTTAIVSSLGSLALLALIQPRGEGRGKQKSAEGLAMASWVPSSGAYFARLPGWRRAASKEVSSDMREKAKLALQLPIRSVVEEDGYRIALETHFNATKGEHKGATIFLRKNV